MSYYVRRVTVGDGRGTCTRSIRPGEYGDTSEDHVADRHSCSLFSIPRMTRQPESHQR